MYHDRGRSSHEVEHKVARFSTADQTQVLLYRFYQAGRESFHPWEIAAVAGMLRHAVMAQVPAPLKEYVSNHGEAQVKHLPLPNVRHEYADSRVRRAVIVEPLAVVPVHRVAELRLKSLDGPEYSAVRQTEAGNVFDQYLRPAKRWVNVTPVLLSGYDTKHGQKDPRKQRKMLLKRTACRRAGTAVDHAVPAVG